MMSLCFQQNDFLLDLHRRLKGSISICAGSPHRIQCLFFTGGLCCFRQSHENLCEHSLHLHAALDSGAASGLTGALPHSLPSTPDIENAELTPILPFLYLGNEHDAQDMNLLQRFNVGYVLNVTTHLPLYHYNTGLFVYKRLPATDSNKQNLRQYFEEAFEFIGMTLASLPHSCFFLSFCFASHP